MDIHNLPKEALFTLLLQVEPEEFKTVCFSRNKKVREICNSEYFRETYKRKYCKFIFIDKKDLNYIEVQWIPCGGFHVDIYRTDLGESLGGYSVSFKKGIFDIGEFLEKSLQSLKIDDVLMTHIDEEYVIINVRGNTEIKIPFVLLKDPLVDMKFVFDDINQNYPEILI